MTVADHLRAHLAESGESMRALSLRAGLHAKAVADILNIPGLAPRHKTLVALSQATGRDLLAATATEQKTYAELIATAREQGDKTPCVSAAKVRSVIEQPKASTSEWPG